MRLEQRPISPPGEVRILGARRSPCSSSSRSSRSRRSPNVAGLEIGAPGRVAGQEIFAELDLRGKAVLVETGGSRHLGTETYLSNYPYLTEEAADVLVADGARLVGIDSPNVDDNRDGRRPLHTKLLSAESPIVEHLKELDRSPPGSRFFAVPPRTRGFTSFPVRAFALVEQR